MEATTESQRTDAITRIEGDIARWETRVTELASELEQAETRQKEVEHKRNGLVLSAVGESCAAARKELDGLRKELFAVSEHSEELRTAVNKVREKISDLKKAHSLAERQSQVRERAELSRRQAEVAGEIDKRLAEAATLGAEWLDMTLRVYQINGEIGETLGRTPRAMFSDALAFYFRPLVPYFIEKPSLKSTLAGFSGRFAQKDKSHPAS